MVSVMDFRSSSPGLSPGGGHCVVFLGKALYSHSASLYLNKWVLKIFMLGVILQGLVSHPGRSRNTPS